MSRATSKQICRLTVNACGWVVLDTQVNVLIDAKPKVACVTEVASEQLILLYLQSTLLNVEVKCSAAASVIASCHARCVKYNCHVEFFTVSVLYWRMQRTLYVELCGKKRAVCKSCDPVAYSANN